MKWNKYTIETTTAAEDFISAMLDELGIEGVEIENNVPLTEEERGGMFIDFPPQLPPDDGTSRVSFYLSADEEHTELLAQVRARLEEERRFLDIGSGEITFSQTEDVDWMDNWKQYFKAFSIGNILIKPTWEKLPAGDEDKLLIEIDPGISFGTGKHETTQLCIRQLQKYMQGKPTVLDIGCGSGILSIAALRLGALHVVGTDIDPICIRSTQENMEVNGIEPQMGDFYAGDLIADAALREQVGSASYEIVVANILADVIIKMAPAAYACLKQDGILISSGIIDFKEKEVKDALEQAGFAVLEINHMGEWVNITAKKG